MALTIPCSTARAIGIDEYLEYIRTKVDLGNLESLAASASRLRELAGDRTLVVNELNKRIGTFFAGGTIGSAQTLTLGSGADFYVRANIWPAIRDMTSGRAYQNQFAYNLAHDHNFTFLTVNYLGPGYETEIYEYEYEGVEGYVGERVELRFLEKARFATGMVMLYRASRDVHIQYPPEDLTITLNLMVSPPGMRARDQYQFDLASRTISAASDLPTTGRASFLTLAGLIGDDDTQQLLTDLATRHPSRRARLEAYESLARQAKKPFEVWRKASNDAAPLIANRARRELKALESG